MRAGRRTLGPERDGRGILDFTVAADDRARERAEQLLRRHELVGRVDDVGHGLGVVWRHEQHPEVGRVAHAVEHRAECLADRNRRFGVFGQSDDVVAHTGGSSVKGTSIDGAPSRLHRAMIVPGSANSSWAWTSWRVNFPGST